jgi:methyl-accepting chemotaxis protein
MWPMKIRKNYIADKRFQLRFIGVVVFSMFLFLLMVGWTVYSNIWAVLLKDTQNPYFLVVKKNADTIIFYKLILLMIVVTVISFFISHKFAGPVHRISKASKDVGEGNLNLRVNLRRGDEFINLVDDFNQMVKSLHILIVKEREQVNLATGKIKEISKDIKDKDLTAQDKGEILKELSDLTKDIEKINSQFRV